MKHQQDTQVINDPNQYDLIDLVSAPSFRSPMNGKTIHLTLKVNLPLDSFEAYFASDRSSVEFSKAHYAGLTRVRAAFEQWFDEVARNGIPHRGE